MGNKLSLKQGVQNLENNEIEYIALETKCKNKKKKNPK